MKYIFQYDNGEIAKEKKFNDKKTLNYFINKLPPNIIKDSKVLKYQDGLFYSGQYYLGSRGLLVKF